MASRAAPASTPLVGRTWPDVATDVLKLIGVPLVLVGALLFAFYMFYQVMSANVQREDSSLQAQLTESREALMDTLRTSHALQGAQIQNIQAALTLQTKLAADTALKQQEIQTLQTESARFSQAATTAKAQAAEAGRQLSDLQLRLTREVESRQAAIAEATITLNRLNEDIEQKNASIAARAESIEALRAQLIILSQELINGGSRDAAIAVANNVLTQGAEWKQALNDFARSGNLSEEASKRLIGIPIQELRDYIHDSDSYSIWTEDTLNNSFFGIGAVQGNIYKNTIEIATDGQRSTDVETYKHILAVALPEYDNYFDTVLVMKASDESSASYSYLEDLISIPTSWSIKDYHAGRYLDDRGGTELQFQHGTNPGLGVTDYELALRSFGFDGISDDEGVTASRSSDNSLPYENIRSYLRAKNLTARNLPFLQSPNLTSSDRDNLVESFTTIFRAMIACRTTLRCLADEGPFGAIRLTDRREKLGSVVALILRGKLKGFSYDFSESDTSGTLTAHLIDNNDRPVEDIIFDLRVDRSHRVVSVVDIRVVEANVAPAG
jgi:hypothetical protein